VFNNLSQDHLDYHETMDNYFEAKALLFTREQVHLAVVNRADLWGARLVERLSARRLRSAFSLVTFSPDDATDVVVSPRRASFQWRGAPLELNMGGRFNVANAVAAATVAAELGVGGDAIAHGLATVPPVRGRFEAVDEGQPFSVLVDFAHTPAALAEALGAARELSASPGRVIVVLGAGGDRDRSKRPLLGRVAGQLADVVVVTSDNPRSEDPRAIIQEVATGVQGQSLLVEADRARAIVGAIGMAEAGDVVLVAGKGHETGQDFGSHVEPFDDVEVAGAALRSRGHGASRRGSRGAAESGPGSPALTQGGTGVVRS
jgi:UDP-N-acetylmuramoyl-L-alanyl-D-glutamate--2,6-diaminopimelate ligase